MFESEPFALNPVQFFALSYDCHYLPNKKEVLSFTHHLLPSTHHLTQEELFIKGGMGWNEEGIAFCFQVNRAGIHSFYPEIEKGDSIELFIDTRDLKTAGFNTRFCHHFFFLPQPADGTTRGEKTHFRTEDSHPLCDPESLECQTLVKRKEYVMQIFIPTQCLYGYDPKQFDRLGFTYRVNRFGGHPQHFAVVSSMYQVDQQPSLWASVKLVK